MFQFEWLIVNIMQVMLSVLHLLDIMVSSFKIAKIVYCNAKQAKFFTMHLLLSFIPYPKSLIIQYDSANHPFK